MKTPDRAVLFGFAWKGWQLVTAPITILLIAEFLDEELQGFFYTFGSLVALQTFFELGFYVVITNVASHEWSKLTIGPEGRIVGDETAMSRLSSLARFVFRWYAGASALFLVVALATGWALFSARHTSVQWQAPWIALSAVASLTLWASPFSALLEGCAQVMEVHRFSLFQAIASNVLGWSVLAFGGELWAAVAIAGAQLIALSALLAIKYRRFFSQLLTRRTGEEMIWRTEVLPMQWRLALSGLVNYFAFSLFNPVMFYYHGASTAGKMGMTLQIVSGIQAAALIWLKVQVPRLGALVARKEFRELNQVWLRTAVRGCTTFAILGLLAWLSFGVLHYFDIDLANRILSQGIFALLLIAGLVMNLAQAVTAYLRAHKEEPILVMSVVTSLLIGALVWILGRKYGPVGATSGYLAVVFLILYWDTAIWIRYRRRMHGEIPLVPEVI